MENIDWENIQWIVIFLVVLVLAAKWLQEAITKGKKPKRSELEKELAERDRCAHCGEPIGHRLVVDLVYDPSSCIGYHRECYHKHKVVEVLKKENAMLKDQLSFQATQTQNSDRAAMKYGAEARELKRENHDLRTELGMYKLGKAVESSPRELKGMQYNAGPVKSTLYRADGVDISMQGFSTEPGLYERVEKALNGVFNDEDLKQEGKPVPAMDGVHHYSGDILKDSLDFIKKMEAEAQAKHAQRAHDELRKTIRKEISEHLSTMEKYFPAKPEGMIEFDYRKMCVEKCNPFYRSGHRPDRIFQHDDTVITVFGFDAFVHSTNGTSFGKDRDFDLFMKETKTKKK